MAATSDPPNGAGGPPSPAAVRTLLFALPYLAIVGLYAAVSVRLLLPGVLVVGAVALLYERIHSGARWRHPAGWLCALALAFPTAYVYVHERLGSVLLLLAPVALVGVLHLATRGRFGRWWAANPFFVTLLYLLAAAGLLLGVSARVGLPPMTDDVLFELYAAPMPGRLDRAEMEAALEVVDAALTGYERDAGELPAAVRGLEAGLPTALRQDGEREVWVTLWLDRKRFLRGHARGGRLFEDIARATDAALDETLRWQEWIDGAGRVRVQLDVVDGMQRVRARPTHQAILGLVALFAPPPDDDVRDPGLLYQLFYEIEPGVDGLYLHHESREAWMLPGDAVTRGLLTPRVPKRIDKVEALLRRLCRDARAGKDLWAHEDTELYKFRSFCFGRPVPGGAVVELYRGNVLRNGVDSQALLDGIEETGGWLLRTVQPDGRFDYEYYPNEDRGSKGYNIVRHAGCVYGLFHMYELALTEPQLREDANDYLEAGLRALGWVYDKLDAPRRSEDDAFVALIDEKGRASSGAAALTLLSFLERPLPEQVNHPVLGERLVRAGDEQLMEGLGLFLLEMIDGRGKVYKYYRDRLKSDEVGKEPLYFPGESMLALVRFYERTGDERWLEGARRIGDWQVERYHARRPNPDHWVMQALWHLYQATGDDRYGDAALSMGDRHASEQFPPHWPPFLDYFGCYRRYNDLPRTTRACSRSEAMGGVMHTAWATGADATRYEDALLRAAEHLLENQWRPENSYFLPNPDKARGAIRMGLVDNHCRIDNNQHAIVGLHRALEAARKREGVPMPDTIALPPLPDEAEQRAVRVRFGEPLDDAPDGTDAPPHATDDDPPGTAADRSASDASPGGETP